MQLKVLMLDGIYSIHCIRDSRKWQMWQKALIAEKFWFASRQQSNKNLQEKLLSPSNSPPEHYKNSQPRFLSSKTFYFGLHTSSPDTRTGTAINIYAQQSNRTKSHCRPPHSLPPRPCCVSSISFKIKFFVVYLRKIFFLKSMVYPGILSAKQSMKPNEMSTFL